jgi:branched-chain amino acid aminotransferase
MRPVVLIDGHEVAGEGARISVFDRGFLYGDSVFEVLRTYDSIAVFARAHVGRLLRGCAAMGLEPGADESMLTAELHGAVRSARLALGEEAVVRIIVTAGEGSGLERPVVPHARRVTTLERLSLDEATLLQGIDAFVLPRVAAPLPGAKTGSYLTNVLARREARRNGAAEAVFVDESDGLVEGAGSNVFAYAQGRLVTAADDAGVLPGITRAEVVRLAGALGLRLERRAPRLSERWDELFVTSSVRGVVPIRALRRGAEVVFKGAEFPVARRLREGFHAMAKTLKFEA